MGTTGLIFAAIAIAWLAYLVPHFVRRRDDESVPDVDPADRFADSMRIIRNGTAPLLDQDLERIPTYEVSTPQTRQAAIRDLHRQEVVAAARRRRVLLVLLAGLSLVIGLCATGVTPWWSLTIPVVLLVAFVVGARISVGAIRRSLDLRYQQIRNGSNESTIFLSREDLAAVTAAKAGAGVDRGPGQVGRVQVRRGSLGPGADHQADVRLQAARPAYGAHHRPLRSHGRRHLRPAAGPGDRRPARGGGRGSRGHEGDEQREAATA